VRFFNDISSALTLDFAMIAVLAANPYLGIEAPDMDMVYYLFSVIVVVFIFMAIFRSIGRMKEKKRKSNPHGKPIVKWPKHAV
tara:strand:- start:1421 stop:1669 length:249 start_codon:yes stop_codon:yes gene_type:complete